MSFVETPGQGRGSSSRFLRPVRRVPRRGGERGPLSGGHEWSGAVRSGSAFYHAFLLDSGAEMFSGFAGHVGAAAAKAAVKNAAETGVRVDGGFRRVHVVCTELLSFFHLGESRGDATADATGIAVHDFQRPYWNIVGVSHAHCVAHILRGLDALTGFHGEAWSAEMRKLLQRVVHEVNEAVRAGEPLSA